MLCIEHDKRGLEWRQWNSEEWRYSSWENWVDKRDQYLKFKIRGFEGKLKCRQLWLEAFHDLGCSDENGIREEDFDRYSRKLQWLIETERTNCQRELRDAQAAWRSLQKKEKAKEKSAEALTHELDTARFTVKRLQMEGKLLSQLSERNKSFVTSLPTRQRTPIQEEARNVPGKRAVEEKETRSGAYNTHRKKKKLNKAPVEPETKRQYATEQEPTLKPSMDAQSGKSEPAQVAMCSECRQRKMLQETIYEVLNLSEEYMQNLEATKHLREPGYTGKGNTWDPRVIIQCADCHTSFHCGCVRPAVRNYPSS